MLEIKNLKKEYKSFTLDCSMDVKKGEITGLVGPNGAGKSTTFKAILGLINIDGGSVSLFGKDVRDITAKDKERIGVVLSDSSFSGYLKLRELIPIMKNLYSQFDETFFRKEAERFSLPFDKAIREFSTGMKAKLKTISALSHNADLLILDEPTSGLDVVSRDDVLTLLREYMERNEERSILISSHISTDLETLCDDIYIIDEGHIILHEDTDVLLSDYGLLKMDPIQYERVDKRYIIRRKSEGYGWCCLTNQRQFYLENEPDIVNERGSLDSIITMMTKGERE